MPTIGDIILNNKKVGAHSGYYNYTIGQRRGLGVSHACPLYVKKILPEKNQIIVAEEKDLYASIDKDLDLLQVILIY